MNKTITTILWMCLLSSCSKLYNEYDTVEPVIEYTSTAELAGEWTVKYLIDGSAIDNNTYTLLTYNTANQDNIFFWISDKTSPLGAYKVKCSCDTKDKSFADTGLLNYSTSTDLLINILNGNIMENVIIPGKETETDSIYFEIEMDETTGVIYQVSGSRRNNY